LQRQPALCYPGDDQSISAINSLSSIVTVFSMYHRLMPARGPDLNCGISHGIGTSLGVAIGVWANDIGFWIAVCLATGAGMGTVLGSAFLLSTKEGK